MCLILSDPFLVGLLRSVQSKCQAIDCCSSCRCGTCQDIASADGTLTDCSIAWVGPTRLAALLALAASVAFYCSVCAGCSGQIESTQSLI